MSNIGLRVLRSPLGASLAASYPGSDGGKRGFAARGPDRRASGRLSQVQRDLLEGARFLKGICVRCAKTLAVFGYWERA